MWVTIVLGLLAGFFVGNGLPYYIEGSAGRPVNPSPFPDSSVVNVVVGWIAMVIGGVAAYFANFAGHPVAGFVSSAVGVLVVGLIHANNWQSNPWHKQTSAVEP